MSSPADIHTTVETEPVDPAATPSPPAERARQDPKPKRINVAITPDTVAALELVMEREGVSLTEALRRLVGYGDFVYRSVKRDGATVLVKVNDTIREVVLL